MLKRREQENNTAADNFLFYPKSLNSVMLSDLHLCSIQWSFFTIALLFSIVISRYDY